MGSTGPSSINPATGQPYGLDFPVITIADMVRAQARLLDHLGIADLFCVIGGSMGGMQVLEWAASYPERVFSAVPIACAARHSAQNIAFHEVGRQAIMADPDWCRARYLDDGQEPAQRPGRGAHGRAHHLSVRGRRCTANSAAICRTATRVTFGFDADFQVESYLRHQGLSFVDRFDANSYLYITRAMDYFDLAADHGGVLANAFAGTRTRFCLVSFTSDWLFPTAESREIVHALNAVAANVSFVEIETDKGHDAFLLDEPELFDTIGGFLNAGAVRRGMPPRGEQRLRHEHRRARSHRPRRRYRARRSPAHRRYGEAGQRACSTSAAATARCCVCSPTSAASTGAASSSARPGVNACVAHGLSVIQGDADTDLADYPDVAFDYAISEPDHAGDPLAAPRAGAAACASASARSSRSPISAIGACALALLFGGRMPVTDNLPDRWYDTPNIHLCTIQDFLDLCRDMGAKIERAVALNAYGTKLGVAPCRSSYPRELPVRRAGGVSLPPIARQAWIVPASRPPRIPAR